MYLVLTALLAMNVSKEVLMGFVTVNESLERTNKTFSESTVTMMNYFNDYVKKYPDEKFYYSKAEESARLTGAMYQYIEELKKRLIEVTESVKKNQADTSRLRFVNALDNYDIPTYELFGDDEANPVRKAYSAYELRQKLTETHDKILGLFSGDMIKNKFLSSDLEAIRKKISAIKPVDPGTMKDGVKEDWQMSNFYHLPLAAVITNLSKIQSDLRNVESETVNTIAKSIMTTVPKVNQFAAAIHSPSNYVQVGEKYQSSIFLAAGNSNVKREVFIGDFDSITKTFKGDFQQLAIDANGRALFEMAATTPGLRTYKGVIKMTKENDKVEYFPFEQKFTVAPASVAVSADYMNVVYAGVENPITISAAGIAPQNLVVSVDNGSIPQTGPGKFNIRVMTGTAVNVDVFAKTDNGTKKQGTVKLRVKKLPKPDLTISGKGEKDKSITKGELQAAQWLTAKPDGFVFNVPYKMLEFDMTLFGGGIPAQTYSSKDGKLTQDMKNHVRHMSQGGKMFIEAKVKSPDEYVHHVNLIMTIK